MRRYIPGLAEWNARNRRAIEEYRNHPLISGKRVHYLDGCDHCRYARTTEPRRTA